MMALTGTVADQGLASQIRQLLINMTGESIGVLLWKVLVVLIIVFVGKLIVVLIKRALGKIFGRSKKITELMAKFILKVVGALGWIVIAMAALDYVGINMTPVIAGLGITGVVLGFALQESISNFFSGFMIIINEPFRIGDYIDTGDLSGTIISMDMMCVTMNTPDNKKITIANKLVWGSPIVNYSDTARRRVDMIVTVPYGSDLEKVKKTIKDLLLSYDDVRKDPEPVVEVSKLNNSLVELVARPWVLPADYWTVYWRFQSDVLSRLDDEEISAPHPQLDVHLYGYDGTGGVVTPRK